MSNDFEGRLHKNLEILAKTPEVRDDPFRLRNLDSQLCPVRVTNVLKVPLFIQRDIRFDWYILKIRGTVQALGPLTKYRLAPGESIILPNDYMIYSVEGAAPDEKFPIGKSYGHDMRKHNIRSR